MNRLWGGSVAFRLALGYGALVIGSMSIIAAVFYFGTVGVLARSTDAKLQAVSARLAGHFRSRGGAEALRREIDQLLNDGIEQDTEVYLLTDPDGRKIAGNLAGWTPSPAEAGRLEDRGVIRDGRPSVSRLLPRLLPNGAMLVVGRDLQDRIEIEHLVWRALAIGGVVALLLAAIGALVFRRLLEARVAAIRRTARDIEAGDLSRRVPLPDGAPGGADEFARLSRDINRMLDRIEHLMDGVRHVSNAIAHDLRTPLGRIRSQLDEALRSATPPAQLTARMSFAIAQIDDLIRLFDRLLLIAEAESGARRQSFAPVQLAAIIADVVELFDAAAEACGSTLLSEADAAAATLGDKNLLASAVANLVENALKYAGPGATVRVWASCEHTTVAIVVEDDGPGIAAAERPLVTERFYRADRSRSLPGNGLGLSIVAATAALHWGSLALEDAAPGRGLRARLILPRAELARSALLRAAAA